MIYKKVIAFAFSCNLTLKILPFHLKRSFNESNDSC